MNQQLPHDVANLSVHSADESLANKTAATNVQTDVTGFCPSAQTAPNAAANNDVIEETASATTVFQRSADHLVDGFVVVDSSHWRGYDSACQQKNIGAYESYSVSVAIATGTNVDVHTDQRSAVASGSGSVGCMIVDAYPMASCQVSGSAFVRSDRPGAGRLHVEVVDDDDDEDEVRDTPANVSSQSDNSTLRFFKDFCKWSKKTKKKSSEHEKQ